jgi:ABC-type transport system involved in multi-copper enzyme maturation permease subunit
MFALVFDREPLRLADLPDALLSWVQVVGGFAAVGLVLWLLLGLPRLNRQARAAIPRRWLLFFIASAVLSLACYAVGWSVVLAAALGGATSVDPPAAGEGGGAVPQLAQGFMAAGGAFSLLAVGLPFFLNLLEMLPRYGPAAVFRYTARSLGGLGRGFYLTVAGLAVAALLAGLMLRLPRVDVLLLTALAAVLPFALAVLARLTEFSLPRVWALAALSFKEAIRRRVLYAVSALLLVVLFGGWFISSKPEDQVKTYVSVFFLANSVMLLFTAVLLSSFSIPGDIKQQTIHTVVTKPVQRFEIVLGRFLGFFALMTLVLVVVTGVSLAMVLRGVTPEAAAESLKAREPLYGKLRFENTEREDRGVNVGREFDYRSYITRPSVGQLPMTARWDFAQTPAALGQRPEVQCEYRFDVYRTTKGKEGADVSCSFKFFTWRYQPDNDRKFRAARDAALGDQGQIDRLAEEYGYYEINSLPVTDFHTQGFTLPGGLFRSAAAPAGDEPSSSAAAPGEGRGQDRPRGPALTVRVVCDSATQYVGMAGPDLYVRLDRSAGPESGPFALNFFKAAFGLWLQLGLVIGLAVVLSTYLNGVITLLLTLNLYLFGLCRDFIEKVAVGKVDGLGGPVDAMMRMSRRELVGPSNRDGTAAADQIAFFSDAAFRWFMRRFLNTIPDVDRFDLTRYVAEGFNIPSGEMVMAFLLLAGYLLPWAVLAYYLMKCREVASSS